MICTGVVKSSSSQPCGRLVGERPVASTAPVARPQRPGVRAGVAERLVEPDAGDVAVDASAVNFTPSVTAAASPESGVAGTVESVQILHGHCPAGGVALRGDEGVRLRRADLAPLVLLAADVTVNVVPAGSGLTGVNVATVSVAVHRHACPGRCRMESVTVNETVLGTTGLLNVTVGSVVTGLLDEPG